MSETRLYRCQGCGELIERPYKCDVCGWELPIARDTPLTEAEVGRELGPTQEEATVVRQAAEIVVLRRRLAVTADLIRTLSLLLDVDR
jgi:hypothetical protein